MASAIRAPGLGIRLIVASGTRLAAAFAGMAVAVVVMFVELGLLLGVLDSQAMIATLTRGDLVVMNIARTNLHKFNTIGNIRLGQVAAFPDVAAVVPVYQGAAGLKNPDDGTIRRLIVISFPPDDAPLAIGKPEDIAAALRAPGTVLFDRLSRPIYSDIRPGQDVELDGTSYRVGGLVAIGPDIINDGAMVMSDGSWLAAHPNAQPIMGVVRLKAGTDPEKARRAMLAALPPDVAIYTPDEVRKREINFTLRSAPIGILFGIGMLAGLVIGAITCYQILFNEIVDRIDQYATLKAMGFSNAFLRRVILEQALLLSTGGFIAGTIASALAYAYVARRTALAIQLSPFSVLVIFVLATAMSVVAGLLALRRVESADPAELY